MLELREARAIVLTCVAEPAAIDAAVAAAGTDALRVAPDEAMLLGDPGRDPIIETVRSAATGIDPDALVVDTTDGWTLWSLEGEARGEGFARLSHLVPRDGFAQGDVAHVPAKVLVERRWIAILVPSMWRDAVRERILADCADLDIREAEPRRWEPSA